MKQFKQVITNFVKSRVPQTLPQTSDGVDKFVDNTITLGGWDKDNQSLRHAVLSYLMHLDMNRTTVTNREVVKNIKRAIANQVAYGAIQEIKQKEKDALKAAE